MLAAGQVFLVTTEIVPKCKIFLTAFWKIQHSDTQSMVILGIRKRE